MSQARISQARYSIQQLKLCLDQGLVVSCQPVDDGPLDEPYFVGAMAKAAVAGGAVAIRIEGVENVLAARERIAQLIIGIVKRIDPRYPIIITPELNDVLALAQAGADIIAIDGTDRSRPHSREQLIELIHQQGCAVMVDCATAADGDACHQMGADIIGTTLSGYTDGETPIEPDLDLVRYFARQGYFTMAEGRYDTPQWCAQALQAGANAVTVGTVLTRLEVMTRRFVDGLSPK